MKNNIWRKALVALLSSCIILGSLSIQGPAAHAADEPANMEVSTGILVRSGSAYRMPNALVSLEPGIKITAMTVSVSGGTVTPTVRADYSNMDGSSLTWTSDLENNLSNILRGLSFVHSGSDPMSVKISMVQDTLSFGNNTLPVGVNTAVSMTEYNGHYYMFVKGNSNISWSDAYSAAKTYKIGAMRGYLATITRAEEEAVLEQLGVGGTAGDGWAGGSFLLSGTGKYDESFWFASDSQDDEDYRLRWVCGPEAGADEAAYQSFEEGQLAAGAPANGGCYLRAASSGWTCHEGSAGDRIKGYFVEFGGYEGDPRKHTVSKEIKIGHTITLDCQGGSGTAASVQTDADGVFSLPANPSRSGYSFAGWFLKDSGIQVTNSTAFDRDTTVYARWGVVADGCTYVTDANAQMGYRVKDGTFDLRGVYGGAWKQTTFSNNGYTTYLQVNNGAKVTPLSASGSGLSGTYDGLHFDVNFEYRNSGETLQIIYTVSNPTASAAVFSVGSGADIQIGTNDSAPIYPMSDASGIVGFYMQESAGAAQFNFFGRNRNYVTNVDTSWYGPYGSRSDNVFSNTISNTNLTGTDSGNAWSWTNRSIQPGETQKYSVLIGIGAGGSEKAAASGGFSALSSPTGTITYTQAVTSGQPGYLSNFNAYTFIVKMGETILRDTYGHYTINKNTATPSITFNESVGLNADSVLTVQIVAPSGGTTVNNGEPMEIEVNISSKLPQYLKDAGFKENDVEWIAPNTLKLKKSVVLSDSITMSATELVLDLNGYTLTGSDKGPIIESGENTAPDLTVIDSVGGGRMIAGTDEATGVGQKAIDFADAGAGSTITVSGEVSIVGGEGAADSAVGKAGGDAIYGGSETTINIESSGASIIGGAGGSGDTAAGNGGNGIVGNVAGNSGKISGGAGGESEIGAGGNGGDAIVGDLIYNFGGEISGGAGGESERGVGGTGGDGVDGTVQNTNLGQISGGSGGASVNGESGGDGGVGVTKNVVSNEGGEISGGSGGENSAGAGGQGGAGVLGDVGSNAGGLIAGGDGGSGASEESNGAAGSGVGGNVDDNTGGTVESGGEIVENTTPLPGWAIEAGIAKADALYNSVTNTLTLTANVTLTSSLEPEAAANGAMPIIDLGGKTLSGPTTGPVISAATDLTLRNTGNVRAADGRNAVEISSGILSGILTVESGVRLYGGAGADGEDGGDGGAGIVASGTASVVNHGSIYGGAGGEGTLGDGGNGGAAISIGGSGSLKANDGYIFGGVGGDGASAGGNGGAGVSGDLSGSNNGTIMGGAGGAGESGNGGSGGDGVTGNASGNGEHGEISGGAGGVSAEATGGDGGSGVTGSLGNNLNEEGINGGNGGSGAVGSGSSGADVENAAELPAWISSAIGEENLDKIQYNEVTGKLILLGDIDLADTLVIPSGTDLIIDLNGKKLSAPAGKPAVKAAGGDCDLSIAVTLGVGRIIGATGEDGNGAAAIDFSEAGSGSAVNIDGAVELIGGNGKNAEADSGESGGNGGPAVKGGDNTTVNVNDERAKISGGAGGNGGSSAAENGGDGGNGGAAVEGNVGSCNGEISGGAGGAGGESAAEDGTGGKGGSGGSAVTGDVGVNGSEGKISGGSGGEGGQARGVNGTAGDGGNGGAGVGGSLGSNLNEGEGSVSGGNGGQAGAATDESGTAGDAGESGSTTGEAASGLPSWAAGLTGASWNAGSKTLTLLPNGSIELSASLVIPEGENITIDLNGSDIIGPANAPAIKGSGAGTGLTLINTSDEKGGSITGAAGQSAIDFSEAGAGSIVNIDGSGSIEISGGDGASATSGNGNGTAGAAAVKVGGETDVNIRNPQSVISGGNGGAGAGTGRGGAGGAGIDGDVSISAGNIAGGNGGGAVSGTAGAGGAGITGDLAEGEATGSISGGNGGSSQRGSGGAGGNAVSGDVGNNAGSLGGGRGGAGNTAGANTTGTGGKGGSGVGGDLTGNNTGAISGGVGGEAGAEGKGSGTGGAGGNGVSGNITGSNAAGGEINGGNGGGSTAAAGAGGNGVGSGVGLSGNVRDNSGSIGGGAGGNGSVGGAGGSGATSTVTNNAAGAEIVGGTGGDGSTGRGGRGGNAVSGNLVNNEGGADGGNGGRGNTSKNPANITGLGGAGGAGVAGNVGTTGGNQGISGGNGGGSTTCAGGIGGVGVGGDVEVNNGSGDGAITGGDGGESESGTGGAGAAAVSGGVDKNNGAIGGGNGGESERGIGGAGGTGVTDGVRLNNGDIDGGNGGTGTMGGVGGTGIVGGLTENKDNGSVSGGAGGESKSGSGSAGGTAVSGNVQENSGDITGGTGGSGKLGGGVGGTALEGNVSTNAEGAKIAGGTGGVGTDGAGGRGGTAVNGDVGTNAAGAEITGGSGGNGKSGGLGGNGVTGTVAERQGPVTGGTTGSATVAEPVATLPKWVTDAGLTTGNAEYNSVTNTLTLIGDTDVQLEDVLLIPESPDITIDLNGHDLIAAAGQPAIKAASGDVDLVIKDTAGGGTITGSDGASGADGADGQPAIDFTNAGAGSSIEITDDVSLTGGNGGNGNEPDGNGGNGAPAIAGGANTVIDADAADLSGGNGGDGTGTGNAGTNANEIVTTLPEWFTNAFNSGDIPSKVSYDPSTGIITVKDDVTMTNTLALPAGADITLNLNGKTLTGPESGPAVSASGSNTALSITDTGDGGGKLLGGTGQAAVDFSEADAGSKVEITGNKAITIAGGDGENATGESAGGDGGSAILGGDSTQISIDNPSANISGGAGGSSENGAAGNGGSGIVGDVIKNDGTISGGAGGTSTGGNGGNGGSGVTGEIGGGSGNVAGGEAGTGGEAGDDVVGSGLPSWIADVVPDAQEENIHYNSLTGEITLTGDIDLTNPIVLPDGADITIDLNGHNITAAEGQPAIKAAAGDVDLVVKGGGTITGSDGADGADGQPAIDFTNAGAGSSIEIADAVSLAGGDGGNGNEPNGNGGNGAPAIAGGANTVIDADKENFSGGQGGDGTGTGNAGTNANEIVTTLPEWFTNAFNREDIPSKVSYDPTTGRITVNDNVTMIDTLEIPAGADITLDLNGKTLTGPTGDVAIKNGGELSIESGGNGAIKGADGSGKAAVENSGALDVGAGTTITGGSGSSAGNNGAAGGAGIVNKTDGTVSNNGAVSGGAGGSSNASANGRGGNGGVGIENSAGGEVRNNNSGSISGGNGGASKGTGAAGNGGAGLSGNLNTNNGTVGGGNGGTSEGSGAAGAGGAGVTGDVGGGSGTAANGSAGEAKKAADSETAVTLPTWAQTAGLTTANAEYNSVTKTLKLKANAQLTQTLTIPANEAISIDLGGHNLTGPTTGPAIKAASGAVDLTVKDTVGGGSVSGSDGAEGENGANGQSAIDFGPSGSGSSLKITGDISINGGAGGNATGADGNGGSGADGIIVGSHAVVSIDDDDVTVSGGSGGDAAGSGSGGNGGAGINGDVDSNAGTVSGGSGGNAAGSGQGGDGGSAVNGNVIENSGRIMGGSGGNSESGSGGDGGNGVSGSIGTNKGTPASGGTAGTGSGEEHSGSSGAGVLNTLPSWIEASVDEADRGKVEYNSVTGTLTVKDDLTLIAPLALPEGADVSIDLAGKTLTGPSNGPAIKAADSNTELTVSDSVGSGRLLGGVDSSGNGLAAIDFSAAGAGSSISVDGSKPVTIEGGSGSDATEGSNENGGDGGSAIKGGANTEININNTKAAIKGGVGGNGDGTGNGGAGGNGVDGSVSVNNGNIAGGDGGNSNTGDGGSAGSGATGEIGSGSGGSTGGVGGKNDEGTEAEGGAGAATAELPEWATAAGLTDDTASYNTVTGKLTLKDDVTLTRPLDIPAGTTAVLELAGHDITGPANKTAIVNNGTLTVQGGGSVIGADGGSGRDGQMAIDNSGSLTVGSGTAIIGGNGGAGSPGGNGANAIGNTNGKVYNNGTVSGGSGGVGNGSTPGGSGGSGIQNTGTGTVYNYSGAAISGGSGGESVGGIGGTGGSGVAGGSGLVPTVTDNSGSISGGPGGNSSTGRGGAGGSGVDGAVGGGTGTVASGTAGTRARTVTFDPNGGTVEISSLETGSNGRLSALPEPVYSGYIFQGWFDAAGDKISTDTVFDSDVTVTARWTVKPEEGTDPPPQPPKPDSGTGAGAGTDTETTTAPNTEVIVDGRKENIGQVKETESSTTIVMDQTKLKTTLESAVPGSAVEIEITTKKNEASAELVVKSIEEMAAKEMTLVVRAEETSYELPTGAVDTQAVLDAVGADDPASVQINVSISKSDTEVVSRIEADVKAAGSELVGVPVEFKVTATYNGKAHEIERFTSYAQRIMEVSREQAARTTTAVVHEADGSLRHVPTSVFEKNGKWFVQINSCTNSAYALIYNDRSFADAKDKWYGDAVSEMASRRIVNGKSETVFDGDAFITRAEFAAIIARALGLPADGKASFTDVSYGDWFYGAVGTAAEYGLISGYADGSFAPNANISRQEAMTIVCRAAGLAKYTGMSSALTGFTDASSVAGWASEAVQFNVGSGLIKGSGGELKPLSDITRAESAALILRLMQKAQLINVKTVV